jgi:hypothetical protein
MYRSEWVDRGYPSTCASASAAPAPPDGFVRVYHLCEATYAIENIQKSRLKVATFADANDPFELSVFYSRDPAQRLRLKQFTDNVAKRYGIVSARIGLIRPFGVTMATRIVGSRSASTFRSLFYCLFVISLSARTFL